MDTRQATEEDAESPAARYLSPLASRLAWVERVLAEARNPAHPVLERVKFLALSGAHLDEFFEIPVAALLQRIEDGDLEPDLAGRTPHQELGHIQRVTRLLAVEQRRCWRVELRPGLASRGLHVTGWGELDAAQQRRMRHHFTDEMDPLLAPVVVDPAHPFPGPANKGLCLAVLLRRRRRRLLGVVTLPPSLPRWIRLPAAAGEERFLPLAELVAAQAGGLFSAFEVVAQAVFRATRNSNLYLNEEEARSIQEMVSSEVSNRRKGAVVRLEIEAGAPAALSEMLRSHCELDPWQMQELPAPVNLARLLELWRDSGRADLRFTPLSPRPLLPAGGNLFARLRGRDVLLHHPYDSYAPVEEFLASAQRDPRVQAVRVTLYRTGSRSPLVRALMAGAAKKSIAAVVELKARFDEVSNLGWSRQLQEAGVQVFHGLVGLKTHCKLALVVRRDEDGCLRRYVHLGTGNYNAETAAQYSDFSLLSADAKLAAEAEAVFRYLTAAAALPATMQLAHAPDQLGQRLRRLIEREADHARHRRPARLLARMNGLLDRALMDALYEASSAGVEMDLIVRGPCALRPGVPGLSERIRVISVAGRFLEHSRALYLANGGQPELYLSSADWMPRNLYGRVELMFPVRDPELRRRVRDEGLLVYLADSRQAWRLHPDGSYRRASALGAERREIRRWQTLLLGDAPMRGASAQEVLTELAHGERTLREIPEAAVWTPEASKTPRRPRSTVGGRA